MIGGCLTVTYHPPPFRHLMSGPVGRVEVVRGPDGDEWGRHESDVERGSFHFRSLFRRVALRPVALYVLSGHFAPRCAAYG